ncbi:PREDICTED: uncharacterized protein LOC108576964 [Habropoda laboriosa]|uniref:uncharacterized protein LOC108576964 n=1 Tax=Habropoda laboriosa TaxID=597456 RepID=UPI00083DE2C9|nr:PREDICTED: uncharacterized protein LOC108576964 [Habropoda laboriosa]
MKTILAVGCLFLIAAVVRADDNDAIMEAVKEQTDACVEELQITKEDIEKLLNNDVEDDLREKAGCLKACVMRSTGIFENGVINIDNVQKMLEKAFPESPAKIAEKLDITRQCIEKVKDITEECDLAYNFCKCSTSV